jgi:hypothetical protein
MCVEGTSDAVREVEIADVVGMGDAGTIEIEGDAGAVAIVANFAALRVAGLEFVAGSDTGSADSGALGSVTGVRTLEIE